MLSFLLFFPSLALALQINEIMYDLPGSDSGREWIELFQEEKECVNLSGWKLYEGGTNHRLNLYQGQMILCAGEYAIIADKPEKFLADNHGFSGTIIDSSFSLSNTGETLALKDSAGTIIENISYNSDLGAKGNGKSLERNSTGWFESIANSTPGAQNSIVLELKESENKQEAYTEPTNYSPLIDFSIIAQTDRVPPGSKIETVVLISSNYLIDQEIKVCSFINSDKPVSNVYCKNITIGNNKSLKTYLYNSLKPEALGNLSLIVQLHHGPAIKEKATQIEILSGPTKPKDLQKNQTGPTGALVKIDEKPALERTVLAIKNLIFSFFQSLLSSGHTGKFLAKNI